MCACPNRGDSAMRWPLLANHSYMSFYRRMPVQPRFISARSVARNSVELGFPITYFAVIKAFPLIDNMRS